MLVGNLGDGLINVYDPSTYAYLGQLIDSTGTPILSSLPTGANGNYTGLWEIVFGKGTVISNPTAAQVGDSNTLYFVAGLSSETHGLLGSIAAGATSTAAGTFGLSTSTQIAPAAGGQPASVTLSIEPTNGFKGSVTLACRGLPAGATCQFEASPVTVNGNSAVTTKLSIATNGSTNYGMSVKPSFKSSGLELAFAMLMPFGAVLTVRRALTKVTAGSAPPALCY
ncbi:MAG: hypothetical protein ABI197_09085 [Granulicella sp.]